MKITLKIYKEFDAKYLKASCNVQYWEDTTVDGVEDKDGSLIPCRFNNSDLWEPLIEISTGKILNWNFTKPTTASIHYTICDCGVYKLLDENKELITEIDGYVPKVMRPKENGYDDYVVMDIDKDGIIQDWNKDMIKEDFINEDED